MMAPEQRMSVRIGGASGFWGDSSVGAPQLVRSGEIDYLVFDYLAELTMSILAGARLKKPELGYATDFVTQAMRSVLKECLERGIRVVSNAGGVNPLACAQALSALSDELGLSVRIAVVTGDDVMPLLPQLREQGPAVAELQSGAPLPEKILTANAYLGALPIKRALDAGAQVVITGRCVDSAVTLGVLMHEFNWNAQDYDKLSGGSLAGHILECGCQATGGLHTDWQDVPDWAHIGYPIAQCFDDGSFVATKPANTGGLVVPAVIAEQMLYEIGDPAAYLLPDVTCDFTGVTLEAVGANRVRVAGARGHAPSASYKVSATYLQGYKLTAQLTIVGFDAVAKAKRTAAAILERTSELLAVQGFAPYSATHVEALGSEANYGPHAQGLATRETVMRLTVTHPRKEALEILAREISPAGTSWSPGTTGGGGGRQTPAPSIRQYAFLLDKSALAPRVHIDGEALSVDIPLAAPVLAPAALKEIANLPVAPAQADWIEVPLVQIAWARSGDKGDISNIGVIARRPEWVAVLRAQLTESAVASWLGHHVQGPVRRFEVPGIHAFNFVCEQALGGGGMASLRSDPLGKSMAQQLLSIPVRIPSSHV